MPDNASLLARREAAVPRGVSNATAIYADRAENAELWDVEGRRFIDFAGGIAVLNAQLFEHTAEVLLHCLFAHAEDGTFAEVLLDLLDGEVEVAGTCVSQFLGAGVRVFGWGSSHGVRDRIG